MSLKSDILLLLEEMKGSFVSGEEIAKKFDVSRSAIWKVINSLKEEGYEIDAVPRKGYALKSSSDILSFEGIYPHLKDEFKGIELRVLGEVTSTNLLAKKEGDGRKNPLVIVANSQTEGKGRKGRDFFSPPDTGIYASFLLEPCTELKETMKVTIAAAVAVKNTLCKFSSKDIKIKWVNDIFADNKKVCGILTEAITDLETRSISKIIVGIGINVSTENFPPDISGIAGSAASKGASRNLITAELINNLLTLYKNLNDKSIIEEYKKSSLVLGKNITYTKNNIEYEGLASDINENGNLIVKRDKIEDILSSGEVSLRSSSFAK